MENLMRSARLLVSDLASTIVFLAVLLIVKNVMLAVAIGIGIGAAQIGWFLARRKPVDAMQWLSIGLVVVSGAATLLTSDPRFVMLKPSVIYCVVGAFMLRRLREMQEKYPFIGDVRGLGAMNGMEVVLNKKDPKPNGDLAKSIVGRCYDKGLIMLTAGGFGNVIRHLVPLVVTDEQLDKALKILNEAMAEKAE